MFLMPQKLLIFVTHHHCLRPLVSALSVFEDTEVPGWGTGQRSCESGALNVPFSFLCGAVLTWQWGVEAASRPDESAGQPVASQISERWDLLSPPLLHAWGKLFSFRLGAKSSVRVESFPHYSFTSIWCTFVSSTAIFWGSSENHPQWKEAFQWCFVLLPTGFCWSAGHVHSFDQMLVRQ